MAKVEFIYSKGGKRVPMAQRYAETLRKLGHGTYETRMLTSAPLGITEPRISVELAKFAEENKVDVTKINGTGKDGRIKKSDIEAVIASRDLV